MECKYDGRRGKVEVENFRPSGKEKQLKICTNYVLLATNSKAVHDQNLIGKVKFSLIIGLSQIKKDLMVNNIPEDLERDQTTMMLFLLLNHVLFLEKKISIMPRILQSCI